MERKYTIKEFIDLWMNSEINVSDIVIKYYSPILEKRVVLEKLIEKSVVKTSDGLEYIDSVLLKLNYVAAILLLYTNLDIQRNDDPDYSFFNDYDMLKQHDIIELIIAEVDAGGASSDIDELYSVMNAMVADFEKRTYSVYNFISKIVTNIGASVDSLTNYINDELLPLIEKSNIMSTDISSESL